VQLKKDLIWLGDAFVSSLDENLSAGSAAELVRAEDDLNADHPILVKCFQ